MIMKQINSIILYIIILQICAIDSHAAELNYLPKNITIQFPLDFIMPGTPTDKAPKADSATSKEEAQPKYVKFKGNFYRTFEEGEVVMPSEASIRSFSSKELGNYTKSIFAMVGLEASIMKLGRLELMPILFCPECVQKIADINSRPATKSRAAEMWSGVDRISIILFSDYKDRVFVLAEGRSSTDSKTQVIFQFNYAKVGPLVLRSCEPFSDIDVFSIYFLLKEKQRGQLDVKVENAP